MSETKRRDFLRILGVGSAAGLTSCSRTAPDALQPYVVPPEEAVRGQALWYRSTCRECPAGCGVEVRVREGRVHKVEGNPMHPVNAGGLCARGQAAPQGLYNPDRLRTPLVRDGSGRLRPATWDEALQRVADTLSRLKGRPNAAGVVTGSASGAMEELIRRWLAAMGSDRHLRHEPLAYESLRAANRICFGLAALPVLRFADARAIYVFGTDALETFLSPVGYTRGIAEARRAGGRMVYAGSRLSLTGARADEWVRVSYGGEGRLAAALARELLALGAPAGVSEQERTRLRNWCEPFTAERAGVSKELLWAMAKELREKPSLAVTGGTAVCDDNALATALAVNLLNVASGAVNRTVRFDRSSILDRVATRAEALAWQQSMAQGSLEAVLILESNPVYSSPGFAHALRRVPLVVALASAGDETTEAAHVVLPVHTPLEAWGDWEPWSGVHSLQQPAMRPVFATRHAGDVLIQIAGLLGYKEITGGDFREFLLGRWRRIHQQAAGKEDFETFWAQALARGGYWQEAPERPVKLGGEDIGEKLAGLLAARSTGEGYRLQTYPSLAFFDGRNANRPWLQELPDPVTQAAWDSWVEIHPKDAARLGVATGDLVRLEAAGGSIELAAYVYPGIQPGTVATPLGQGHTAYGRYATGVGASPLVLLNPSADPATGGLRWSGTLVRIAKTGARAGLAIASGHDLQEHREIARSRSLPEDPVQAKAPPWHGAGEHHEISLYRPHEHKEHRWGMVIDLDACTSCNACLAACYAENNVPIAGRAEAARGRTLSWIRIERFFGPGNQVTEPLQIDWVPMLCQQCDNAPCEPVCPVFAAYHSSEGLNGQIYNRCVGTRYCANNCPYKARRFNWYEAEWPAPLAWQLNPDVTVRTKGVMEKCTFCVQRIVEAKDRARREGRRLKDGDVTPACAQTCPAQAIVLGDLNDPESRVSRMSQDKRRYKVFEELNTRPAVTYLERERRRI